MQHQRVQLRYAIGVDNDITFWMRADCAPISVVKAIPLSVSSVGLNDDNGWAPHLTRSRR